MGQKVRVLYTQEQLDKVISYLNSLELAVGKNVINAQRIAEIFNTLNAGKVLTQEEEYALKSLAASKQVAPMEEVTEPKEQK